MILADKIIVLRKKNGWSQEQLAEELGISRQSVSKWESGMSIPDIDKILKLSELFGVSTDYLLREEIEEAQPGEGNAQCTDDGIRVVTAEEAGTYMEIVEAVNEKMSAAISLFIISPITLMVLAGIAECTNSGLTEEMAGGLGIASLLIFVVIGVFIIIYNSMKLSPYEYLEKEVISLEYGVAGIVAKKKQEFAPRYRITLTTGIIMCIVGVIPLVVAGAFGASELVCICMVGLLLLCCAIGVFFIVSSSMIQGSYQKLLQEEDYSVHKKQFGKKTETLAGVYWCIITAIYLGISFTKNNWGTSWIIWPVAGVSYAAFAGILNIIFKGNE